MENKVSIEISQEAIKKITDSIEVILQNLPKLVNLKTEERSHLLKLGDKSLAFVTKCLEYAIQNPSVVPAFLDVNEFKKDVESFTNFQKILYPLQQLTEMADDTAMLTGSEAYTAALIFYNAVKVAVKAGVPGMKNIEDDLKERFPGRSRKSSEIDASSAE
jgi:hypothetical protein